ncbi:MAG: DNA-3-methyladenine glycosylase I [Vulcanimicrobiaceae bacterium]
MPAIPEVIVPKCLGDYLEVMTRAVFQAGLSWKSIADRWEVYRAGFCDFDAARVAAFHEGDIDRVLRLPGMLRSQRKIRASIENARTMLELDGGSGGFVGYLHGFATYPALAADLHHRFKFMGAMNVWYFLFRVGEPVPEFERWVTTIPGDHPRMREMVARAALENGPIHWRDSEGPGENRP